MAFFFNIGKLAHRDKRQLIKWMQRKKLLARTQTCRECKKRMKMIRHQVTDGYIWQCRRTRYHPKKCTKSIRHGSMFTRSHRGLHEWLMFIYRFCQGLQLRQIDLMADGVARSSTTLSKMAKKLRKVCTASLKRMKVRKPFKIGGSSNNRFVVIDESKFIHKRKCNRGRFGGTWARKGWVFGMLGVHRQTRRPILNLVKTRARTTLVPIIEKHVRQNSCIYSDSWRAYVTALNPRGYRHFPVNHRHHFVDPVTGSHTQHIERFWKTVKDEIWRVRGNRNEKMLKTHLKVIEWNYWLGRRNKNGIFAQMIHDIAKHYEV